jgi:RNA recognition motif-containing protein
MVMRDPNTKRARGFGFITFVDPTSIEKVLVSDEHELDGKKVGILEVFPPITCIFRSTQSEPFPNAINQRLGSSFELINSANLARCTDKEGFHWRLVIKFHTRRH